VRGLVHLRPTRSVEIPLDSQDSLWGDYYAHPGSQALLVLHGIGGNHRAGHCVSLARHWLGAGRGPVLTISLPGAWNPTVGARLYHAGCSRDLEQAFCWLARSEQQIWVAGFSLGANIVVKWTAEYGAHHAALRGSLSMGNPWLLESACRHLDETGAGRWYRAAMLRTLRKRASQLSRRYPGLLEAKTIEQAKSFAQFDSDVTAKLHGFASAREYYQKCSSRHFLGDIQKPLFCLDSLDDPCLDPCRLPTQWPSSVTSTVTTWGGHLGYLGGKERFWLENWVIRTTCPSLLES
jgi:predicted alpha/beta-fold hydrolase